jgi:hypothetical protein
MVVWADRLQAAPMQINARNSFFAGFFMDVVFN